MSVSTLPAQVSADQPRTWSFTSNQTGEQITVTCMAGCQADHSGDTASPTNPDDIWCYAPRRDVMLPVNTDGQPEEVRVLSTTMNVMPFARTMAYRLPHVSVEVMQDSWIEGLDPDGLETVIRTLAERLDDMRAVHALLVQTRAAYRS